MEGDPPKRYHWLQPKQSGFHLNSRDRFVNTSLENRMSEILTLALYFIVCKELGTNPAFPGRQFRLQLTRKHVLGVEHRGSDTLVLDLRRSEE